MNGIILSANNTPIFKYIVWVLGKIMEGIFNLLNMIGIPNIGLSIILFTIFVNVVMLPLTYKQQKFSKLSQKMQPEIKAIQKKYEGRRDQDSNMQQNAEVQAVYAKYGVSPTGSCLYLLIQMPILFALYRVIYQMPAYVSKIREAFYPLVTHLANDNKAIELIRSFKNSAMYNSQFDNAKFTVENTIIDCLNRASTSDFQSLAEQLPNISNEVNDTMNQLAVYNSFCGINIGNSPWYTIKDAFANGMYGMLVVALLIPILAGVSQWVTVKLSPQQETGNDPQADSMAASMKTMNYTMPLISVWFCFTLPAGMGLYWVAGAVVRGVIMVMMNKKIDRMDFEALIAQNSKKSAKKLEKMKAQQEKLNAYANMNTRNIKGNASYTNTVNTMSSKSEAASSVSNKVAPTSTSNSGMFAKANMVKDFNERNNR